MTLTVYWPIGRAVFAAECDVAANETAATKFVKDRNTIREFTQCGSPSEAEAFCKSLMQGEMACVC